MNVVFTGDRTYLLSYLDIVRYELYRLARYYGSELCIHVGDAAGVDQIVRSECFDNAIRYKKYEADWINYGKAAGPIRNARMLNLGAIGLVIAVHEDISKSKGTKNCLKQAKNLGIPTKLIGKFGERTH